MKAGVSVRAGRKYREYSLGINKVKEMKLSYSWELVRIGAHNPGRPTSKRSCHGLLMEQYIFRTVLAGILNVFYTAQTSQQNLQTYNDIFCILITFSFPF